MADWVQILMGDLMEKRELDPAHPLSIGEKCDCGYHLPPGSCGENLITFFFSIIHSPLPKNLSETYTNIIRNNLHSKVPISHISIEF